MLHTRTALEYRDGAAAVVSPIVGVDRIVDEAGDRLARLAAERAMDAVLADSFPASDPPSWNPGIIRPHPADRFAAEAVPARDWNERPQIADVMDVSRPPHGERTLLQALMSVFAATGIALLFGVAILLVGLPIALVVGGLLEAAGWLFGISVR
jgi:hypothetical protein